MTMTRYARNILIVSIFFTDAFKEVHLQHAMSVFAPAIFPMPYYLVQAPIPMMVVVPSQVPPFSEERKIITTTKRPAPPPCPPCICLPACTPAFFSYCSLCHLKCRCRTAKDTPDPMLSNTNLAYAMPVPIPPLIGAPPVAIMIPAQDSSESTEEYTDSSYSESY